MESARLHMQEDGEDLEAFEEVMDSDDDQSWTSVSSEDNSLSDASDVCSLTERSSSHIDGDLTRLKSFSLLKDAVISTQARLARVAANVLDPTSTNCSAHKQEPCTRLQMGSCTSCDVEWQVFSISSSK